MINTKITNKDSEKLNLLDGKEAIGKNTKDEYKGEYNMLFPTKMSSSNFLLFYTLFLLNKKSTPLYGKEMLREIQSCVSVDIWNPSHGTYYPLLEKMVKAGYIEIVKTISSKKFYSITELGKKELELRLAEFKPMLIKSFDFFSKVFSIVYDDAQHKSISDGILKSENKPKPSSNEQVLEMLATIDNKIEELGTRIENECIEIKFIKSGK
jgi:DNA-binding PadR family transcriptional regulator